MPKGRTERVREFECVCLRDVAGVLVDDGASHNHWALILVAEPASRLQEPEFIGFRDFGEVVVEGENVGGRRGGAGPHGGARSKQAVDGLLRYAVVISHHDDAR